MKTLGYIFLKGVLKIFGFMPLRVHYFNARWLAFLIERVFRYRRDDVIVNLSRCFPEKDYPEIKKICRQFYGHFADLVVEAVWFGACNGPSRLRRAGIVSAVNSEVIDRLYDVAPGVAVMYSHCGNWELFGGLIDYCPRSGRLAEHNISVVYRRLKSAVWDRILRENRLAPLNDPENFKGYVESADFVRYVFSHKDEKMFYCVNNDQHPYFFSADYLKVPFFYDDVATMSGIASLAHKFGMAVTFLRMPVASRGHYELEFVTICEDASKMSVNDIMHEYYRLLEEEIRLQPYNYLWTHHRWWKPENDK